MAPEVVEALRHLVSDPLISGIEHLGQGPEHAPGPVVLQGVDRRRGDVAGRIRHGGEQGTLGGYWLVPHQNVRRRLPHVGLRVVESPDLDRLELRLVESEEHACQRQRLQRVTIIAGDRGQNVRLRAPHHEQGVRHQHLVAAAPPVPATFGGGRVVDLAQDCSRGLPDRLGHPIVLEHRRQRADRPVVLQGSQGVECLVPLRFRG